MTQPVNEPTTQRSIGYGRWRTNQLERRPPPFLGTIWPWIALVNAGQTLPGDNAEHDSLYKEAYWDPAITDDPTVGGGVYSIEAVSDGEGDFYWELTLNEEGWYDIETVHQLEEATTDGGANIFFSQNISFLAAVFDADTPQGYTAPWTASGPELSIQPWISEFRRVWMQSGQRIVDTKLKQNSTVDKGVNGHIKCFYLAGVGGGTQNTDWDVALINS